MAVERTFSCDRCGADAGRLIVYAPGERPRVSDDADGDQLARMMGSSADRARVALVSGLGGIGFFEVDLERTLAAVAAGDPAALYAIEREYVPFWCPTCPACYCAGHWYTWMEFDEGFFDELRGRCPNGHERMLID